MDTVVHIGLPHCGTERIQDVLAGRRDQLLTQGVLFAASPGRKNHTRLFMAVTDPDHIDPLRAARGHATIAAQSNLYAAVLSELQTEIAQHRPNLLILSAVQFGAGLSRPSEIARLRDLLKAAGAGSIRIVAHVDEQARLAMRNYADQLREGRLSGLQDELDLARKKEPWAEICLNRWDDADIDRNQFPEVHLPPFWLDYLALVDRWETVFGDGSVTLRAFDADLFASPELGTEISQSFGLPALGPVNPAKMPELPSVETLRRLRALNNGLDTLMAKGRILTPKLRHRLGAEVAVPGNAPEPGCLTAISERFSKDNNKLLKRQKALTSKHLKRDRKRPEWIEAAPSGGFRLSQYLTVFLPRIDRATRIELKARKMAEKTPEPPAREVPPPAKAPAVAAPAVNGLSDVAEKLMTPAAKENYFKMRGGPFAPHNRLGHVNEEDLAAPFPIQPMRTLPPGSSGNVIVGCMKNEGPYILEWVAYHRAMGVDNFLIYTNGCEDSTSEILDRLQELGYVQHRNNDNWKGNSPQQHALNRSLKEDLIKNADWIIHIDVDEFMNVRCGNGTLADFHARVPDATNVAMTWRLFGHNDIQEFRDDLVIDQFDTCAPKFCPKPHTAWGFKTMFKNIGAYEKISCHRPNKLIDGFRKKVKWVNGSGLPMPEDVVDNGWRSSKKSVGYDLLQLNHYALRSAESFLVKRQRGRALHVDRSIGLSYWVRMDWSIYRDVTIKRSIPRTKAQIDEMKADARLAALHDDAVAWHQKKAAALKATPEFRDLLDQAIATKLTEMERVAFAMALEVDT
ncbi:glycosyl transferase family 2 [Actibacterium mucosum KCTC 23349]|uniref:Glycosyl transferase family 2 n=1 Tax=Actibacterium mucosum KCTC 23349 TaxID=1454373 RepID=A0A037ZH94_9RHOB|nr:glycosyltransferase family 2 protein [Actibacterium mucosum]KAJ55498.1 glycosyl transferase family 2 [Actibacterium mucosum KCTC 23349]